MVETLKRGPFETFDEVNQQFKTLKTIWIGRTVALAVGFIYLTFITCKGEFNSCLRT